ncbi:hypothetical protein K435DRAFT_336773 [Dendrothele bispora CBS 962.96]|uniref:Septin-type G domain-containing protein n=1 Tax=Dendrothele bispora (strain CBS 962.96) TaxID=1314807 RepID=A0A4S8LF77_DENBC|nr:hypothetical protein K435DRAFT_336773 [Dendrothele bispora CBS 962.96]
MGAGKSTFINCLFGDGLDHVEVGHSLTSCTINVTPFILPSDNRNSKNLNSEPPRVIMLDTPGFDDTTESDEEILRRIAGWLKTSYRKKMVLAGIIYLHDISQDRFTGTARRNLNLFNQLYGEASLEKVVLVSTKWEGFHDIQAPAARERELKDKHWNFMIEKRSQVARFRLHSLEGETLEKKGNENAWDIVSLVRQRHVLEEKGKAPKKSPIYIQQKLFGKSMNTKFQTSDIVILVTGSAGAGRSTFINDFLGKPGRMKVGEPYSLTTCTTQIDYEIVNPSSQHKNRLVIVDTPGFDNENKSDFQVWQEIASWIQESFPHGVGRGGIIYLHDISLVQYRSMGNTNLGVLIESIGKTEGAYRRIVLTTTKWSKIGAQEGIKRQAELESQWNQLNTHGSKLDSLRENSSDAKRIVDEFCRALEGEGGSNFGDWLKDVQKLSQKPGSSSGLKGLLGTLLGSRA